MLKKLMTATVLAGAAWSPAALADCVDEGDGFVICTGVDEDGVEAIGANYVEVRAGAVVRGTDTAIRSGALDTNVFGTVEGAETGVLIERFGGALSVIGSEGSITATRTGLLVANGADFFGVNRGAITGGSDADGIGVQIGSSGTPDGTTFRNEGQVASGGDGVVAGSRATVVNEGSVTGGAGFGVSVGEDGRVTNTGAIVGDIGVSLRSGEVFNRSGGTITGTTVGLTLTDDGRGTTTVDNDGVIRGATGVTIGRGLFFLDNGGVIEGTDGVAVRGSDANDIVTLSGGGAFVGDVLLGGGNDDLSISRSAIGTGTDGVLFDLGDGDDIVSLFGLFSTDITSVVMSDAFAGAAEIGVDGAVLVFAGAEEFSFTDGNFTLAALFDLVGNEVPLPGAALFALTGFGFAARLRRKA